MYTLIISQGEDFYTLTTFQSYQKLIKQGNRLYGKFNEYTAIDSSGVPVAFSEITVGQVFYLGLVENGIVHILEFRNGELVLGTDIPNALSIQFNTSDNVLVRTNDVSVTNLLRVGPLRTPNQITLSQPVTVGGSLVAQEDNEILEEEFTTQGVFGPSLNLFFSEVHTTCEMYVDLSENTILYGDPCSDCSENNGLNSCGQRCITISNDNSIRFISPEQRENFLSSESTTTSNRVLSPAAFNIIAIVIFLIILLLVVYIA